MSTEKKAALDPNQAVETQSYVPSYRLKPEFPDAVLKAIGKYPFNQIKSIMSAVKAPEMDHNQLTQVMNALGAFPYELVAGLLDNVNSYIELIQPEVPATPPTEDPAPPADKK